MCFKGAETMEEPNIDETREEAQQNTQKQPSEGVDFRWLTLRHSSRAIPIVAVVGKEISAQFVFANGTDRPIDQLSITIVSEPLCEYDICECSGDNFRRDVEFRWDYGGLLRTTADTRRIVCNREIINAREAVQGWMRAKFNRLGGTVYRRPGIPVDFESVSLTLKAEYQFEGETWTRSKTLTAEEVTFVHKGSVFTRFKRKVREEWIELLVVAIFAWCVGLLSPPLLEFLKSLWTQILIALQ